MRNDYYVYVLCDLDGVPFYVGKGRGQRWKSHESESRGRRGTAPRYAKIREILATGVSSVPKKQVETGLTEEEAYEFETAWIARLGRADLGLGPLTNLSDGGEGASGHVQSPEERAAKSRSQLRPEVRRRKSESLKAAFARPEVKARLVAARRKTFADPTIRPKMDAVREASFSRPEVQARRRRNQAIAVADPAYRARLSDAIKKACERPEVRQAKIVAANIRWTRHRSRKALIAWAIAA